MLTVKEIEEWRKTQGLSRKQLAEKLHVNYKSLCPVLAGTRALSPRLSANIEELMNAPENGLYVKIPAQFENLLLTWAETSQRSVDELVYELLADSLKMSKKF